jgi:hypothetical protein
MRATASLRLDPTEWDFSGVPAKESCACCYFEWARESSYIIKELDSPAGDLSRNEPDVQRDLLKNSPLVYALPPRQAGFLPKSNLSAADQKRMKELLSQAGEGLRFGERYFDEPWLKKAAEWRAEFCRNLEAALKRLSFARILKKKDFPGFQLGMSTFFNHKLWTGKAMRCLDPRLGLETLLVTINWHDFDDAELKRDFAAWIKTARPENVGQNDAKGKNKNKTWQAYLERLALLRLRHHYTFEGIAFLELPESWRDKDKFTSSSEAGRERRAALQTLFTLYPFLPKPTRPRSWRAA